MAYPVIVNVMPTSSIEKAGKTTDLLSGNINFGKGVVNPDMLFTVTNGTLVVDAQHHTLSLHSVLQAGDR
jgi:hypothetical protein